MAVLVILVSLISLYIAYRLYLHYFPAPNINPAGKHVLISGCDTGFGHALAIALDQRGFHVAAGVYVRENIAALQSKLSSNATVFRLDITKQDEIDAAVELVRKKTNTLHALVNNAGIGTGGYIDWTSLQTMRQTMDVNFFGHVAMTKAFLPLLISKRDSRVVNITSVAGFLAGPSMSAYASSKFALEAFSDCLRREMTPWGLRVSIVEPGFMRTPIIDGIQSTFEDFWTKLSSNEKTRWGEEFLKAYHLGRANNAFIKHAEDPAKVVRAFEHAVTNSAPCIRYRPGWQSSLIFFPLSLMPTSFVDWFLCKTRGHTAVPASVQQQVQG